MLLCGNGFATATIFQATSSKQVASSSFPSHHFTCSLFQSVLKCLRCLMLGCVQLGHPLQRGDGSELPLVWQAGSWFTCTPFCRSICVIRPRLSLFPMHVNMRKEPCVSAVSERAVFLGGAGQTKQLKQTQGLALPFGGIFPVSDMAQLCQELIPCSSIPTPFVI